MIHEIARPSRRRIGAVEDCAGHHGMALLMRGHARGETAVAKLDMRARKGDVIASGQLDAFITGFAGQRGVGKLDDDHLWKA